MLVARFPRLWPLGFAIPAREARRTRSSITVLLLGLSGVALLSALLVIGFLIRHTDADANKLAAATISGAVDRERSRVANETFINAHWNEAAAHVYGTMDRRWIHSNYATPIARDYILDPTGKTLFGHLPGKVTPPLDRMISPETMRELLKLLPPTEAAVRKRNDATVLLTRFGGQPALVAFSPIVREDGPARLDRSTYRIFVDIRLIDDTVLAEWARGFSLPNLRRVTEAETGRSDPWTNLLDWRGRTVAVVAWSPLKPGLNAFRAILPLILVCTLLFLGISVALIRRVLSLSMDLEVKSQVAEQAAIEQQSARLAAEKALAELRNARQDGEEQVRRRLQAEERHRLEMDAAAQAIADRLQQTIGSLIDNLRSAASDLDLSADRTIATIVDQQRQAETANSISARTSEMTCEMLDRLRSIAAGIDTVSAKARHSAELMIDAARHSTTAQQANETLIRSVASIQEASNHISGISHKTKLLALNATMEAARAGDLGRGFAVVAGEVKSFSQQTASTARDIVERIHDISQATDTAVGVSSALSSALVSVTTSAEQTIQVTEQQHNANAELQDMIGSIETATRAARDALDSLAGMFGQTATVAQKTRLISTDMRARTEALQQECDRIVAMLRSNGGGGLSHRCLVRGFRTGPFRKRAG